MESNNSHSYSHLTPPRPPDLSLPDWLSQKQQVCFLHSSSVIYRRLSVWFDTLNTETLSKDFYLKFPKTPTYMNRKPSPPLHLLPPPPPSQTPPFSGLSFNHSVPDGNSSVLPSFSYKLSLRKTDLVSQKQPTPASAPLPLYSSPFLLLFAAPRLVPRPAWERRWAQIRGLYLGLWGRRG